MLDYANPSLDQGKPLWPSAVLGAEVGVIIGGLTFAGMMISLFAGWSIGVYTSYSLLIFVIGNACEIILMLLAMKRHQGFAIGISLGYMVSLIVCWLLSR